MRRLLTVLAVLFFASTGVVPPAAAGWDEGVAAFGAKNYQAAAQEFQKLVDESPEGYRSHYMLGMSLARLGRKEEALNHLRKAYDLNPNELSIKLELGRAYLTVRKYREVAQLLGSVSDSEVPENARSAFFQMRGEARLRTNQSAAAFGDFEQLSRLKPKDPAVQFKFGVVALNEDRLEVAITALDRAVSLEPGNAEIKATYANALIKKGRTAQDKSVKKRSYLKAAELASDVVARDPSFDNLMTKMSAELGAGLYDKAAETGKLAQAKNSKDWIVPFYIGQAYTSADKFVESEGPLRKALELADPANQKKVWTQLGFSYEKQKKYAESIAAYQNAGNQAGVTRVSENQRIAKENENIEADNAQIRAMEEEAKRLEEELKKLEEGGGGR